ncbi:MAG: hypothetical protein ABIH34_05500, partial [Nanoarchaeota archaeon]
ATPDEMSEWMQGKDIPGEKNRYMIVKFNSDFAGSGKCAKGMIQNRVPKVRRLPLSFLEMIK